VTGGNLRVRVLLVAAALPLFFVLIYLLPYLHHLALNAGAVVVSVLGALELERLLAAKGVPRVRGLGVLGAAIPAAAYLEVQGVLPPAGAQAVLAGVVAVAFLTLLAVRRSEGLPPLLHKASSSLLVLIYPAFFLSFIVRITGLRQPTVALFFFFSINIVNDVLAYVCGSFLGGRTRLGYPVSPNKSAVGFGAGMAGAVAVAIAFRALFPAFVGVGYAAAAVFGLAMGAVTIAGDLVESALKRSAEVKDSGEAIPGRGGILDSIDSWLLSAPLFYFVFRGV
jgi:phosphatidate cytidylyltransferase